MKKHSIKRKKTVKRNVKKKLGRPFGSKNKKKKFVMPDSKWNEMERETLAKLGRKKLKINKLNKSVGDMLAEDLERENKELNEDLDKHFPLNFAVRALDKAPAHYSQGEHTPWEIIIDWKLDYFTGNALKYICRHMHKGKPAEDIQKAIDCLIAYKKELE